MTYHGTYGVTDVSARDFEAVLNGARARVLDLKSKLREVGEAARLDQELILGVGAWCLVIRLVLPGSSVRYQDTYVGLDIVCAIDGPLVGATCVIGRVRGRCNSECDIVVSLTVGDGGVAGREASDGVSVLHARLLCNEAVRRYWGWGSKGVTCGAGQDADNDGSEVHVEMWLL